jgi:catechol 2,3-dioxygenase-like lactoylglutathione lyase family enzyme
MIARRDPERRYRTPRLQRNGFGAVKGSGKAGAERGSGGLGKPTKRRIDMLADKDAIATLGVKDITTAKKFYEGKLGFKLSGDMGTGTASYRTGNSTIFVYESQYAGTNEATAVTFNVGDEIESIVQTLKKAGVSFEHYDMPDTRREGDLHIAGATKIAWFKDPDGNILALASG